MHFDALDAVTLARLTPSSAHVEGKSAGAVGSRPKVHAACGKDFLTVTPGIRFAAAGGFSNVGDQVRVTTPADARKLGSDYIVVGRPITAAEDPVTAYRRAIAEFTD